LLTGGANQVPGGVALTESQRLFTAHCYANYAVLGCDNPPADRTPKEWVTYVSIPDDLANYGSVVISNALAHIANRPRNQADVPYSGPRSFRVAMVNGSTGNTLSNVTLLDAYSMRFDWKAFS
jgi:hypothetical protein